MLDLRYDPEATEEVRDTAPRRSVIDALPPGEALKVLDRWCKANAPIADLHLYLVGCATDSFPPRHS